jgi:hypothetical protein
LGENFRKYKPQVKGNKGAKANKHKNGESVQNSVKCSTVYDNRITTHPHQNKRKGRIIHNCQTETQKNLLIDHDKPPKQWLHPATRIIAVDKDTDNQTQINIYTDGSKSEQGVGAGIAIKWPGTKP